MTNAEIRKGEYVKLARNQGINKIISSDDDFYVLDKNIADESGFITSILYKNQISEEIVNHSFNLIDLIEEGDYVNGYLVEAIDYNEDETGNLFNVLGVVFTDDDFAYSKELKDINIYSIVTKEQFKSMQYEVREFVKYMNEQATSILTEDERVILRNLPKNYKYIHRDKINRLIVTEDRQFSDEPYGCEILIFNHLFQFIKNGEEYPIEELLKGE